MLGDTPPLAGLPMRRWPLDTRLLLLASLAALWLSGCILSFDTTLPVARDTGADEGAGDGEGDGAPDEGPGLNPCEGTGVLRYEGAPAEPGLACGECGGGVLVCNGRESLRCLGPEPRNPCRSCGPLGGTPGDSCGSCGGIRACDPEEQVLICSEPAPNACGGCDELEAEPVTACEEGGESGLWQCTGPEAVACVRRGENACGGMGTLEAEPGTPCGGCGGGRWACDGPEAVTCANEERGENWCGGCMPLEAEPGSECGECGTWECRDGDPNAVECVTTWNACGGCGALGGTLGEVCEGGILACAGRDAVACVEGASNACGGTEALEGAPPGTECGECGDGVAICTSQSTTGCAVASPRNECGGCGQLHGRPGSWCATGREWVCVEGGAIDCVPVGAANGCGGSGDLSHRPGDACGTCGSGRWACDGQEALACEGDLGGASLNGCRGCATLSNVPGTACGPCGLDEWVCNGTEAVTCDAATPCPLATPTGLTATTDRTDLVRVTWSAVSGATGYEVSVDGGSWTAVGNVLAWEDTAAPAGRITPCTPSASDGTSAEAVELACTGAGTTAGMGRAYRVRATDGAGSGPEAGPATGIRIAGPLTYQWKRSSGDMDGSYIDLSGATTASWSDTTAPSDGSGRWYRCGVSALGASSVTAAGDRGYRSTGVSNLPVGSACTSSSQCQSGNCSYDYCAPAGYVTLNPTGSARFTMGSPPSEIGRYDNEQQHSVTLTHRFFMKSTEVTQGEWDAMNGSSANPSYFSSCGTTCPVERVEWFSVVAYANALSEAEGLTPCYTLPFCGDAVTEWGGGSTTCVDDEVGFSGLTCPGYRLPTEAEWEYAYRAGTTTATYLGDLQSPYSCDPQPNLEPIAWYCENSGVSYGGCIDLSAYGGPSCAGPHPVGSRTANEWGLYDMAGNVHEWVQDWYDGDYAWSEDDCGTGASSSGGSATDPCGPSFEWRAGVSRVGRGGSYAAIAEDARAALRGLVRPGDRYDFLGFRLARTSP